MTKTCRHCGEEFELRPKKPGLIDECENCAVDVPRLAGNMIFLHKTAPFIEIKSEHAARKFAAQTKRLGAGVTRSITASREAHLKEDEGAAPGAIYYSRLGEKRMVKL